MIYHCFLKYVLFLQIKLVNIRPEDIVEGNGKLTLGLIWTIILNFQVSVIRQRLLAESQHEAMTSRTSTSQVHFSSPNPSPNPRFQRFSRVTVSIFRGETRSLR